MEKNLLIPLEDFSGVGLPDEPDLESLEPTRDGDVINSLVSESEGQLGDSINLGTSLTQVLPDSSSSTA